MKANPQNFHLYNSDLQPFARKLRTQMTKAEACMWKFILRAGQMKGYQFRRQRPILNYIADFMCKELMLVIEVDGSIHGLPDVMIKDTLRQKAIEDAGFTVLRFANADVLEQLAAVYTSIENWIISYEQIHPEVSPRKKLTE